MTDTETPDRIDSASRIIMASARTLFRTFHDPETFKYWRTPDGTMGGLTVLQPQIGGAWCLTILHPDRAEIGGVPSGIETITGRFIDMLPDAQVVEEINYVSEDPAYAGVMTLTTSLEPMKDGTKVTLRAVGMPPVLAQDSHRAALSAALHRLARLTE